MVTGFEKINVTDAVGGVGITVPNDTTSCLITVEADGTEAGLPRVLRYRIDGTDPDAITGHALGDNDVALIQHDMNLGNLKLIGITAGKTHIIQITYFQGSPC